MVLPGEAYLEAFPMGPFHQYLKKKREREEEEEERGGGEAAHKGNPIPP